MNRIELGKRLKELRKKNRFSQTYVAENLFISQAAYSLIENSQNGIVAEHIVGLSKLYEVTTDFILKGDKYLIRISPSNGFVPYVKAKTHAGFVKNINSDTSFEEYDWYRIPGFNPTKDHKLFEVEGESMIPTMLPGDIVICQAQVNVDSVLDGSIAVVITKDKLIATRIRHDDEPGYFIFDHDNPEEDATPGRIHKSEIKKMFMVRGKISSVLIPSHEITSNGKMQQMEESIEFLKRELFSINKKVNSLQK